MCHYCMLIDCYLNSSVWLVPDLQFLPVSSYLPAQLPPPSPASDMVGDKLQLSYGSNQVKSCTNQKLK